MHYHSSKPTCSSSQYLLPRQPITRVVSLLAAIGQVDDDRARSPQSRLSAACCVLPQKMTQTYNGAILLQSQIIHDNSYTDFVLMYQRRLCQSYRRTARPRMRMIAPSSPSIVTQHLALESAVNKSLLENLQKRTVGRLETLSSRLIGSYSIPKKK